jgi:predicted lipid-binding transport protein (Tim44 family)
LRDPSVQDLDEWLTAQLTPSAWRQQEANIQTTQADRGKNARVRQLRLTQVVLGAVVGAFIFADLYGWRGLVGGVLLGILVGGLHHSLIGTLAGGVGGWLVGFQYRLDSIVFPVLGCAVGAFLGSWVGDFWKEKE